MEEIGRLGRVLFINDSKATNADSTDKALASWERDIYWILGGKAKEGGITSLERFFPRIAKAYLIGAASEEFAATLVGQGRLRALRTLWTRRSPPPSRCSARAGRRAGRAALARLRLLRPVQELRGARRPLPPRSSPALPGIELRERRMRISRADRSRLAEWWFTVDHALLVAILVIVGAGIVLSLAASPASP